MNLQARPCDALIIRSASGPPACARQARQWVLAATVLGSSMAFIDSSVVNVALPKMEADLEATLAEMTWVTNAYTLCLSALLLIGGAAADQLGRRRMFLTGLSVFALASAGCGLAPDVEILVLARAIQGIGAALLIPCSLAIIGATFDESELGAAIGTWSGASAIAAGGGPLLGGWLVDHSSWRAIFLINPVLAVPTMAIVLRHLRESRNPDARPGLDWSGAALTFAGLGSLVYGLIGASTHGWSSPLVLGSLALGSALLVSFILVERRSSAPMMPLQLFQSRTFSGVNVLTLLLYGALGGTMFFLPFLLIQVHGYSAAAAGGVFLPLTLILAILSRWGGRLVDRFGARVPLVVGPAVVATGLVLLSRPGVGGAYWQTFLLPTLVMGFGMSITVAPLTTTVLSSVPGHQTGVASGINNAVAQVAGLLVIAVLSTVGIGTLNGSLDAHLHNANASADVRQLVDSTRGGFVVPEMQHAASVETLQAARSIVRSSLLDTIRRILWIGAGLALASAICAALMIGESPPTATSSTSASQRVRLTE
jgi:EmrB/QacA subfamily drug resistance transporter